MKPFTFNQLVLILAFTLFFCGCTNQSGQNQSTQQQAATAPTPRPPDFRSTGGMGMRRGY